ncbi:MAG: hypothetical protein WBD48_13440 [Pseudolabrys sp.]
MDGLAGGDRSGDQDGGVAVELPAHELQGECVSGSDGELNKALRRRQRGKTMQSSKQLFAGALALALTIFTGGANGAENADAANPNAVSCVLIKTAAQLQAMKNNLAVSYCLANDIDLSSIANFVPVGDSVTSFTGNFFGNGHVISNLKINNSTTAFVGLFGSTRSGIIRDVNLVNVNVKGTAAGAFVGGLVAELFASAGVGRVEHVSVTGKVTCTDGNCVAGGAVGVVQSGYTVANSWSSASASGGFRGGGLVGFNDGTIQDSFATGAATCSAMFCGAGGLVSGGNGFILRSFATGAVKSLGTSSVAGGLAGGTTKSTTQSFATGSVTGGPSSKVGGLIGSTANLANITDQSYAVGPVTGGAGAMVGGLVGSVTGGATVTNSYWDTSTTGQATSAGGGTGQTTAQLRAALPAGFNTSTWAVSSALSYPFFNDLNIDFSSPLATLMLSNKIFVFVPIGQLDLSQYIGVVHHADAASLATVYTMIARGIGIADNVAQLKAVKINKYYWHDSTQTTTFSGPLTLHTTLSALKPLPGAISGQNVIGQLKVQRLAILRGTYTKAGGGTATHYMLATMFTKKPNGLPSTVIANDPFTGWQVEIDPATKTVVSPSNFPLANFKVNAYQAVTAN